MIYYCVFTVCSSIISQYDILSQILGRRPPGRAAGGGILVQDANPRKIFKIQKVKLLLDHFTTSIKSYYAEKLLNRHKIKSLQSLTKGYKSQLALFGVISLQGYL